MRLKRREIIISGIITIASLTVSVLLYLLSISCKNSFDGLQYASSAFLGVFGSAFVVLLLACFEYQKAKESTLRTFCSAVYSTLDQLTIPDYLIVKESEDIVIEAMREKENRPMIREFRDREVKEHPEIAENPEFLAGEHQISAQKALADEIKRVKQAELPKGYHLSGSDQWFLDEADKETDEWIERASKLVEQYRVIANTDMTPLENSFYDIGFFTDCFRRELIKSEIKNEVVQPILQELDTIRRASWLFVDPMKRDEYYRSAAIKEILNLQRELFQYEERTVNQIVHVVIHQKTIEKIRSTMKEKWDKGHISQQEDSDSGNKKTH